MKVSFDFDTTLMFPDGNPNNDIVDIMKDHINNGNEVLIVTSRLANFDNSDLFSFLEYVDIDVPVVFTDLNDKWPELKKLKVDLHFDDDKIEIDLINKNTDIETFSVSVDNREWMQRVNGEV